jgi:hypothetical protein
MRRRRELLLSQYDVVGSYAERVEVRAGGWEDAEKSRLLSLFWERHDKT